MNNTSTINFQEEDEVTLLDLAIALGEEKRVLFALPILATFGAAIYALTLTPVYTARTTLAPFQPQVEYHVALLKSQSLQGDLVEQLKLKGVYGSESLSEARRALEGATRITKDKVSGVVSIEVDDKDPAFAARLANGYVEALRHRLGEMETASLKQRREFYAGLIQRLQSHPGDSAEVGVMARSRLVDRISKLEIEYAQLRQSYSQEDPVPQRKSRELSVLNAQLEILDRVLVTTDGQGAAQNHHQAVLDVLTRQHELARLDEAREPVVLPLLDSALPPEKQSKPRRTAIVATAGIAGFILGVMIAFIRFAWRRARKTSRSADRLAELKHAWMAGWITR